MNRKKIYIYQANKTGCWSNIGRQGGKQELNLSSDYCFDLRTIRHELLHGKHNYLSTDSTFLLFMVKFYFMQYSDLNTCTVTAIEINS